MWQLAGGDVVSELGRHGLMVTMPPIVALPKLVLGEGHFQGQVKHLFSQRYFIFGRNETHKKIGNSVHSKNSTEKNTKDKVFRFG